MKIVKMFVLLLSIVTVFQSCKSDDPVVTPPAPTVTAGSALSGLAGATVKLTASISAPGGIKSVTVLKNGAPFDNIAGATGQVALEYAKDYVIENLTAGTVVNFTFQVTDNSNQVSTPTISTVTVAAVAAKTIVDVSGNIEVNTTWTKDKIYRLKGYVRVGNESVFGTVTKTATLTIEAGTTIIGERASKGTLVVQRGSKLIAEGTATSPIVFTSERAVGEREAGDWGGVVLCGKGVNNLPDVQASRELEGGYGAFHGGSDAADNSGTLKYVRIEFAGVPVNPNQEINSLTMGSVGSGTTIDYVQASFGLDDSFEWFGGAVNAKHLIAYKGLDDDFDTDNGYSGYVQFGIGIRGASQADISGSNGFESDNDSKGSSLTPFTSAIFANMSIIGAKGEAATSISASFQNGAQLRRNTKLKIYNTVITGYPNGIYVDNQLAGAATNAANGDIDLKNIVLAGVPSWGTNNWGTGGTVSFNPKGVPVSDNEQNAALTAILIGTQKPSEWFAGLVGNKVLVKSATTGLDATLWTTGRPKFTLPATATDLLGATLPATLPAWFTSTNYVGAFGSTTDWTATWAEFSPQSVVYIK